MPIKQFTLLFGDNNYELNVPVNEQTEYRFIDGHEVLTLAVKEKRGTDVAQKEFPWMVEHVDAVG